MSTEARLLRLGLIHLKDDPEALQRAIEERLKFYDDRRQKSLAKKGPAGVPWLGSHTPGIKTPGEGGGRVAMEVGAKVIFADVERGHFFTDHTHVWESVRSGDHVQSMSPETNMMRCHCVLPDAKKPSFKQGDLTEDFFKNKFTYLGSVQMADKFVELILDGMPPKK